MNRSKKSMKQLTEGMDFTKIMLERGVICTFSCLRPNRRDIDENSEALE